MTLPVRHVAVVGAARMGEGIALAFAQAGLSVSLIDLKHRAPQAQRRFFDELRKNLDVQLASMVALDLIDTLQARQLLKRITLLPRARGGHALRDCGLVFEGVPEVLEAKREAFAWIDKQVPHDCVIASTTSTFL